MNATKQEIEACLQRLLTSNKPKIIAAAFRQPTEVTEKKNIPKIIKALLKKQTT